MLPPQIKNPQKAKTNTGCLENRHNRFIKNQRVIGFYQLNLLFNFFSPSLPAVKEFFSFENLGFTYRFYIFAVPFKIEPASLLSFVYLSPPSSTELVMVPLFIFSTSLSFLSWCYLSPSFLTVFVLNCFSYSSFFTIDILPLSPIKNIPLLICPTCLFPTQRLKKYQIYIF